jgi:hypothetical protein
VNPLSLESEELQGFSFKFLAFDVEKKFQPFPSSLFISRAKLVFNSVSYSKFVSERRDICHCQAPKLSFHQKTVLSQIIFSKKKKNLLPTKFCFVALLELFCRVFNTTL